MTVEKIMSEIEYFCRVYNDDHSCKNQRKKIRRIIKKLVENQKEEIHKPKKLKIKKYNSEKLKDIKFNKKIDPNDPNVKKLIEETKKEIQKTRDLQKIDPNIGNLFVG